MWALHDGYLSEKVTPLVPAAVLAQAWRGGARQASLSRLLALCEVEPMTESVSRAIGALLGRSRHDDIVDAAVVEAAVRHRTGIVTSDAVDLRRIARAIGAAVGIVSV